MSSDLDCRAPRGHACANLVPIPRALKTIWSHLKTFLLNESFTYLSDNNVFGIFDSLLLSEAVPCF